jgi:ABC-type Na+ efflux pump permease subunit
VLARGLWRCALLRPVPGNLVLTLVVMVIDGIILAIAAGTDALDDYAPHALALIAVTSITAFAMLGWAGQAVPAERQQGALELALATPLGESGVLWGKLAGLLSRAVPPLLLGLVHGLVAVGTTDLRLASVAGWGVTSAVQILFVAVFAMVVTCRARTIQSGVVRTFGLFFGGITIHLILGALLAVIVRSNADHFELWFFASPTLTVSFPTFALSDQWMRPDDERRLVIMALWNFGYAVVSAMGILLLPGFLRREAE